MFSDPIQRAVSALRNGMRRVLVSTGLALAAGLVGIAGAGFLVAWVFLLLQDLMGPAAASFLTGFGLLIVAAGLLALASNRMSGPKSPEATDDASLQTSGIGSVSIVSHSAFVVAFVIGRILRDRIRR